MKLFELFDKPAVAAEPIRESKELTAAVKLCEGIVSALEANYEGGIDFEPQPEYAGVKGVSRDTSAGIQGAKAAQHKKAEMSLNQTWMKLLKQMKTMEPEQAKQLKGSLQKVAQVAAQKGFELNPPAERVLGL